MHRGALKLPSRPSPDERLRHLLAECLEPATDGLTGVEGGDHRSLELLDELLSVGLSLGLKLNPGDLGVHLSLLGVSGEDLSLGVLQGDVRVH